jgi:hypothetical protein
MGDVRNAISDILDHTSLEDVNQRQDALQQMLDALA